jgi:urease accessory protein
MRRDTLRMRGERPFRMISLRQGDGVEEMLAWVRTEFARSRTPTS